MSWLIFTRTPISINFLINSPPLTPILLARSPTPMTSAIRMILLMGLGTVTSVFFGVFNTTFFFIGRKDLKLTDGSFPSAFSPSTSSSPNILSSILFLFFINPFFFTGPNLSLSNNSSFSSSFASTFLRGTSLGFCSSASFLTSALFTATLRPTWGGTASTVLWDRTSFASAFASTDTMVASGASFFLPPAALARSFSSFFNSFSSTAFCGTFSSGSACSSFLFVFEIFSFTASGVTSGWTTTDGGGRVSSLTSNVLALLRMTVGLTRFSMISFSESLSMIFSSVGETFFSGSASFLSFTFTPIRFNFRSSLSSSIPTSRARSRTLLFVIPFLLYPKPFHSLRNH